MDPKNFEVKSISRTAFFQVYDELSHRDYKAETNPGLVISNKRATPFNPFIEKNKEKLVKSTESKPKFLVPPLNLGKTGTEIVAKKISSSVNFEDPRKKPPSELIAIEIPLQNEEIRIEVSESERKSPQFKNSFSKNEPSQRSEVSNESFYIPIIPKSIQSNKSYSPSEQNQKLSKYMKKINELESEITEKKIAAVENNETLIKVLQECKILEFSELIDSIVNECNKKSKKSEGCVIKCSRKMNLSEDKKLEYFYHALGSTVFDITKLIHRNILRKYIYTIDENQNIQPTHQWKMFGFVSNPEEFFKKIGAPLAFLTGIYVIDLISKVFFEKCVKLSSGFLEVTLEISQEAFRLTKLSKIKKNYFQFKAVNNYFKLTAAAIINWFNLKVGDNTLDDYELTQQVIDKMRDHTGVLLETLDSPLMNKNNINF